MTRFHSDEYINFLHRVTPDNVSQIAMQHGGLEQGIARCKLFLSLIELIDHSASPAYLIIAIRKQKSQCRRRLSGVRRLV